MKNVGIKAIGQYVPKKVVTNHMLEKMVETSDDWITTRTGIKERRIAGKHERASDLAIHAARDALKKGEIDPHTIELIVVATISPDSNFPSVACLVQKAIGARQAAAFDVSAACSGFLYALTTAKQFVATGMYKNALVIAAERFSQIIDWNDRDTCVLFGDGAGACVIAPVLGNHGILSEYLHAQGHHSDIMSVIVEDLPPLDQEAKTMNRPYVEMRGQELFKIAVNSMAEAVDIVLKKAKVKKEEVACVVPHQANDRIITAQNLLWTFR